MPKRALVEHRPLLLLSVICAAAYYFLRDNPIGGIWLMALKGGAVGFLAIYAWRRTRGTAGALIAIALLLGACGDVGMELNETAGGGLFLFAHLVAIALYMRSRRNLLAGSQRLLGIALFLGTPLISYLLSGDILVAVYALALGAMAASAWTSRFPRYRVGIGAVLFVVSDLLIFARWGGALGDFLPDLLIWPLYYCGQLLIATGVVQTLRGELKRET